MADLVVLEGGDKGATLDAWRIRGSYLESCNCEAICPCRRIDGVYGGRSTYGECLGVISWVIEHGWAGDVSLDGFGVALATATTTTSRDRRGVSCYTWTFAPMMLSTTRSWAFTRAGSEATR